MLLSTTYKAFVGKAATSLFTEMVSKAIENGKISPFQGKSFNDNKDEFSFLATQAVCAAEELAKELINNWQAVGDHSTVFFDVEDSPTSRIENNLGCIAEQLEAIKYTPLTVNISHDEEL